MILCHTIVKVKASKILRTLDNFFLYCNHPGLRLDYACSDVLLNCFTKNEGNQGVYQPI